MECNATKNERKSRRKQKRAFHRLFKDMNIKCSDDPTQYLMVCNAGLVTGLRRETLQNIIHPLLQKYDLVMLPGKSYCFVNCFSKDYAMKLYHQLHGRVTLDGHATPLYMAYCETIPSINDGMWISELPPGCRLIKDFISEEEEKNLLESIRWEAEDFARPTLKHRRVKHYGYEFRYDNNKVDVNNPIDPIPIKYQFLQNLFDRNDCGKYKYDQLTINHYLPGQGIPPHIDTHSVFEDTILSLSLGSPCVMDLKRENQKVYVFLPTCSLLVMSGETRYAWLHGISPRHNDVIKTENGVTTHARGTRVSFTFRKTRSGDCECNFPQYCDTHKDRSCSSFNNENAADLEQSYVHKVYEEISSHFSETRHQPWPNVVKFLGSLEHGSLILDIGCGNGKYLQGDQNYFKMGCDRSHGLTDICRNKNLEVLLSDCLFLPYKDESLDAVISIAVIHHLGTYERRKRAIAEIARILRPGGKCLVYVWAKEQNWKSVESTYLRYNTKKHKDSRSECFYTIKEHNLTLPVHENRTEFMHSDVLVPWKKKQGGNYLRYYHVFEEGELSKLCSEVPLLTVQDTYYDQGNWCIILDKNV